MAGTRAIFLGLLLAMIGASTSEAVILEWPVSLGGNGHSYEQVDEEISWTDAKAASESKIHLGAAGYLATATSSAENQFLVDNFDTFHHWLGGFQADKLDEPAGHWQWVTGELWIYTNWFSPQEPNESGGPEDYLVFGGDNAPEGLWQDWKVFGDFPRASRFDPPLGYIVEYAPSQSNSVIPEPTSLLLISSGFLGLIGISRRRGKLL